MYATLTRVYYLLYYALLNFSRQAVQEKKKVDYCFGWQVECAGGGVRAADEELALRPDMDEYVCDVCVEYDVLSRCA